MINALTGSGLQVDKKKSRRSVNVHVPKIQKSQPTTTGQTSEALSKDGGLVLPMDYRSPPFIGTWDNPVGMGIKKKGPKKKNNKKKGNGLFLGKNSPFKGIPLLGALL